MTKKIIKIEYDPYGNYIGFAVSLDAGNSWQDLADTSELLKYQNHDEPLLIYLILIYFYSSYIHLL